MKFSAVIAIAAFLPAVVSAADEACSKTCKRWGVTTACGSDCPPCRTKAPSGSSTEYECWAYLPNTDSCPQWSGMINCGSGAGSSASSSSKTAETEAPSAPSVSQSSLSTNTVSSSSSSSNNNAPVGKGVTIYNNCGSEYKVYRDTTLVPERCLNGNYCQDYLNSNPAFHVRRDKDSLELGKTLVELFIPENQDAWFDISKIAGFNVGAEIKYSVNGKASHTNTCTNVNCPDAYWLCDTAVTNLFSPVYNGAYGGGFTITFCPSSADSTPLAPPSLGVVRAQSNVNAGPFTCRVKLFNPASITEGTIVDGGAVSR